MNIPHPSSNLDTTSHKEWLHEELSHLKKTLEIQIQKEDVNKNPKSTDFLKQTLGQLGTLEEELAAKSSKEEQSEYIDHIQNKLNSLKQLHTSFNNNGGDIEQVYKQMADRKREQIQKELSHSVFQMGQDRPWLSGLVRKALDK